MYAIPTTELPILTRGQVPPNPRIDARFSNRTRWGVHASWVGRGRGHPRGRDEVRGDKRAEICSVQGERQRLLSGQYLHPSGRALVRGKAVGIRCAVPLARVTFRRPFGPGRRTTRSIRGPCVPDHGGNRQGLGGPPLNLLNCCRDGVPHASVRPSRTLRKQGAPPKRVGFARKVRLQAIRTDPVEIPPRGTDAL